MGDSTPARPVCVCVCVVGGLSQLDLLSTELHRGSQVTKGAGQLCQAAFRGAGTNRMGARLCPRRLALECEPLGSAPRAACQASVPIPAGGSPGIDTLIMTSDCHGSAFPGAALPSLTFERGLWSENTTEMITRLVGAVEGAGGPSLATPCPPNQEAALWETEQSLLCQQKPRGFQRVLRLCSQLC